MRFPDNWGTQKRKYDPVESIKVKKPKQVNRQTHDTSDAVYSDISTALTLASNEEDQELMLDNILAGIPYREMLQELFSNSDVVKSNVPVITKAYEEAFMREPSQGERACVMGDNCECMFIDRNFPFVCTEFLLPNQDASVDRQMCVFCSRKITKQLFYDMMYRGHRFNAVIQRYGVIIDEPGEYAREAALCCPAKGPVHCLPLPVVDYRRSSLQVNIHNGQKHVSQLRVRYEDFH